MAFFQLPVSEVTECVIPIGSRHLMAFSQVCKRALVMRMLSHA